MKFIAQKKFILKKGWLDILLEDFIIKSSNFIIYRTFIELLHIHKTLNISGMKP